MKRLRYTCQKNEEIKFSNKGSKMSVGIEIVINRSYDFQNLTFFRPAPIAIFDLGQ